MSQKAPLRLNTRLEGARLVFDLVNDSRAAASIVAHPRYLVLEALNAHRQFLRGEVSAIGLPTKADFIEVKAGATLKAAFGFDLSHEQDTLTVGPWRFEALKLPTELRVTYKSDPVVPNLPSKLKKGFFRGPLESGRLALTAHDLSA